VTTTLNERWAQRSAAILVVGFAVVYAVGLGEGSHLDSDDTVYAQMAREMVQTGNWVDNQWSGVLLFEKPPLYLWTLAICGSVFGWGEASMRLPGTLFALGTLALLIHLVWQLGGSWRRGVAAAALVGVSTFFFMLTRWLMMDVPMLCMVCGAALFLACRSSIGFGVFSGLAVMTKGAAAAPLLGALVVFGLWDKRLTKRQWVHALGLGALGAITWKVLEWIRHGDAFWQGYLGHHVAERVTSNVVPGSSLLESMNLLVSHEPILVFGGLIGMVIVAKQRFTDTVGRLGVCWLVGAVLPIALSTTRLPHYWLPVVPALALLAVSAPPKQVWSHRLAATAVALVMTLSLFQDPVKVRSYWWNPDFGPGEQAIGRILVEHAKEDDHVIAFNSMSNGLTFYGERRIAMHTDDPKFHAIQERVLMIRRAGVLHWMDEGFPSLKGDERRFVVAYGWDESAIGQAHVQAAIQHMRQAEPMRSLRRLDRANRVLINDAGIGEPIP